MNRNRAVLMVVVALFVAANAYLLATRRLGVNWEALGIITAAGLTLALYSFLYQDNPVYRFAEHLFVGVAAAYVFGLTWYQVLYGELVVRFGQLGGASGTGASGWWILAPTVLGLLMLTRLSSRGAWLSRISFAFVVGLGAGFTIPRYISSFVLAQLEPTLRPVTWSWDGLNLLVILVGVLAVLVYFFFSIEHRGVIKGASRVGIYFLMVSFGASFGYTVMGRLSLLIGRMTFLMQDWLHIM
jgi:hypothetical protein